jgi:hypothetical protein
MEGKSQRFPILELKSCVSKILLARYESLMNANSFIPCEKMINEVKSITWHSWKDRLLAERLSRKSMMASVMLQKQTALGGNFLVAACKKFWNKSKCRCI